MPAPFEMISGPMQIYVATAGTAQPEISATPPVAWALLGANISDDGLAVNPEETINEQKTLDSPMTKKLFRADDKIDMSCTLLDMTAETFAKVYNGAPVTTVAAATGTGGYKEFILGRDFTIRLYAVCARGLSPYADGMNAQYWMPNAYVMLDGGPTYVKGEAAGLEVNIMPVYTSSIPGYGRYRAQNIAPL